jgi:hypothetical protein
MKESAVSLQGDAKVLGRDAMTPVPLLFEL